MARGWTYRQPRCYRCGAPAYLSNSLGHSICGRCLAFEREVEATRQAIKQAQADDRPDASPAPGSVSPACPHLTGGSQ